MDMFLSFIDSIIDLFLVIVTFLLVLFVVVIIHELGHFVVARWCGVKISVFSLGFGHEIYGFNDRYGTRWRLAWLPLGGYVKFVDDHNSASVSVSEKNRSVVSDDERAGFFHIKPIWQRSAVVAAGPVANFLFAIVIFSIISATYGVVSIEPRVSEVVPGTPAASAGFESDDLVLSINGNTITSFLDIQQYVISSPGRELEFVVERSGRQTTLFVTPILKESLDSIAGKHQRPIIGIQSSKELNKLSHRTVGLFEAVGLGVYRTWTIITQTISYVGDVVMQRQPADQLGGIIRIADVSGKVAQHGLAHVIQFTALISVSIGLMNLFPVPMLDGGHLLFYAIEALRGRPLSERTQEFSFKIGLALVLALMLFATWNDRVVVKSWLDKVLVEKQP
ncbi:MAG: RIP metalloprotease RseP [Hyphomicrobiaceae bacterium]|nr:RIP metalloprotease RseP [Hyphomicrobiaceae bacterium]